ncbi:FMN-binding protein [Ichthyenterobacterium magnum]|uniref:FMN-binding protein n=1 Tax=Ichthyenterobacterium magnum TaxID=1230530 RepID=A0A420DGI0_9FLAO|nr:FMN-binding protein [Ichthyenterobacterium magnum]RKE92186.1 FMN-binding protein [Ichthyenterobacterium magnum]
MNFKHIVFTLLALALLSFGLPKNIQKKVDKQIKATFEVEHFSLNPIVIDSELAKTLPSKFGLDNLFEIKTDSTFLAYAYISKAASKTDNFDYLVLLDKDLIVIKAKVLVYREDYGGEIGSKRWLKQFIGKTQNDELRYQDNIIAISGATISVRSMTNAMNDLLKSLKILHSKQVL